MSMSWSKIFVFNICSNSVFLPFSCYSWDGIPYILFYFVSSFILLVFVLLVTQFCCMSYAHFEMFHSVTLIPIFGQFLWLLSISWKGIPKILSYFPTFLLDNCSTIFIARLVMSQWVACSTSSFFCSDREECQLFFFPLIPLLFPLLPLQMFIHIICMSLNVLSRCQIFFIFCRFQMLRRHIFRFKSRLHICHFFSTNVLFGLISPHEKA